MKKIFLLLAVIVQAVFANSFDFSTNGDADANKILQNYVQKEFDLEDVDAVGYFWDNKIIGIIKHNSFYNLEGYKLVVLNNDENYTPVKCDVFFDNTKDIIFDNNKIKFYKSVFYKNKKYSAHIGKDKISTIKSVNDKLTDRKIQNIEKLTRHTSGQVARCVKLSDFKTDTERNVNIKYNNLSEKTKHYLDMR